MNIKDLFLTWGMLLVGVLFNIFGIYAIKAKMNLLGAVQFTSVASVIGYFISLARYPMAIVGVVMVFAAPLPYALAVSKMPISVVYPISTALNFLILIPVSVMLLGETVSAKHIVAMALIVVSLYIFYK
ncbi:MAG: hypothetical protein PHS37_03095 [Candidatus Omnitrophica bacterium]|nr:hypothetical protein [Candidatus Omnitrophota bacterium]